jgi:hypothetical protein
LEERGVFSKLLWQELGQLLDQLDLAGAQGQDVLGCPEYDWLVELLSESRLTRYLVFVCVEPRVRKEFMSKFLDGALGESDREVFLGHTTVCERCREELDVIRLSCLLRDKLGGSR